MKAIHLAFLAFILLAAASPALGADNRNGVGVGADLSIVDSDSAFADEDHDGFSVFGKIGITDNWGIFIFYRDMEDDEIFFNGDQSYTQIGVQVLYMWRPDKRVRPHVAFGLSRTDLEFDRFVGPTIEDDGAGITVSGGLEAGSRKIAFFGDYGITVVELDAFTNDDVRILNLVLGVMFRF